MQDLDSSKNVGEREAAPVITSLLFSFSTKFTLDMNNLVPISKFIPLEESNSEWRGEVPRDTLILIPKANDEIVVRYGYARVKTTQYQMFKEQELE